MATVDVWLRLYFKVTGNSLFIKFQLTPNLQLIWYYSSLGSLAVVMNMESFIGVPLAKKARSLTRTLYSSVRNGCWSVSFAPFIEGHIHGLPLQLCSLGTRHPRCFIIDIEMCPHIWTGAVSRRVSFYQCVPSCPLLCAILLHLDTLYQIAHPDNRVYIWTAHLCLLAPSPCHSDTLAIRGSSEARAKVISQLASLYKDQDQ